ncbi:MAG: adenylate/guanylate cyclase domain-containing protein, partial [Rhodospirillales bacterium]|nr:adenylate/guanylate cyclase domain-containing protein [Rhodospirillales bacterium]
MALTEARDIESNIGLGVRVVCEEYNPHANRSREVTVYVTPKYAEMAKQPVSAGAAGGAPLRPVSGSIEDAAASWDDGGGRGGKGGAGGRAAAVPVTAVGLTVRLLIIVAASLLVATLITGITSNLTSSAKLGLSSDASPRLLFGVFVVTFLAVAVPLAMTTLRLVDEGIRQGHHRQPPAPSRPVREERPAPPPEPPPPEAPKVEEPKPEEKAAEPELPAEPEKAEDAKPGESGDPETTMEQNRLASMKFLGGAIANIKKSKPQLDAFNKFGVDLMLAGAMEVLAERNNLDVEQRRKLLREIIEVLGTKASMAEVFCTRYEEYLLEPRYLQMVQTGREAMNRFLEGDTQAHTELGSALDAWNRPASASGSQIITVIFTDMVGSTDMTQARGDVGAQDLVRRHNSIVRNALAEFSGKEIKHTGDGIMASFASTSNAVQAAVAIQRAVAAHNLSVPYLPLHLRIGINSGEPIVEEDDLFGTTVQLAARICAKASPDQIFCTNVVRELSAGKSLRFVSRGEQSLKGFREVVLVYEVLWEEILSDQSDDVLAGGANRITAPEPAVKVASPPPAIATGAAPAPAAAPVALSPAPVARTMVSAAGFSPSRPPAPSLSASTKPPRSPSLRRSPARFARSSTRCQCI